MPTLPIPSPYNFVPLSRHVFFPDWAAQVSQDVPFSDGISGWFEIEVEAMTPLFIRNGEKPATWTEDHPEDVKRLREHWLGFNAASASRRPEDGWIEFFRSPDEQFAIPGTSLKGVLRLTTEIASFSKFPTDGNGRILRKGDKKWGTAEIRQGVIQRRTQDPAQFAGLWDMAETLFGRATETDSHRGRVMFEALRCSHLPDVTRPVIWPVLQTPKGMFAPNYAEQPYASGDTGWVAHPFRWGDQEARLRGWKLYPRSRAVRPCPEPPVKHGRVRWELASPMRPLPAGCRFGGRVHIHNLQPREVGAILWAMTLGEAAESAADRRRYWLALGAAKPFGYGSVAIRVLDSSSLTYLRDGATADLAVCLAAFAAEMDGFYPGGAWLNSPQLRALYAMSDPDTVWPMELRHPSFDDFQAYADSNDHALLAVPGVGLPVLEPQRPDPPRAEEKSQDDLPNLTGRDLEWRITGSHSGGGLTLRRLQGGQECEKGILRKPKAANLSQATPQGTVVRLRVLLTEANHYELGAIPAD
jgi:hypothetical protein